MALDCGYSHAQEKYGGSKQVMYDCYNENVDLTTNLSVPMSSACSSHPLWYNWVKLLHSTMFLAMAYTCKTKRERNLASEKSHKWEEARFFHYNDQNFSVRQVVKVIWHQTTSPPQTDGSIVFDRWRQCALPCGYIGTICEYNWTCASFGPPESSTQMASWLVQPFLQGSLMWQTDRLTDHATQLVTTYRIYVCSMGDTV